MKVYKVTDGYVVQVFDTDTKKWVDQEFVCGDDVQLQDERRNPIDADTQEIMADQYLPFTMIQPE